MECNFKLETESDVVYAALKGLKCTNNSKSDSCYQRQYDSVFRCKFYSWPTLNIRISLLHTRKRKDCEIFWPISLKYSVQNQAFGARVSWIIDNNKKRRSAKTAVLDIMRPKPPPPHPEHFLTKCATGASGVRCGACASIRRCWCHNASTAI